MLVVTIVQHRTSVLDKTACVCSKTSRVEHTKNVHNRPKPAVFVRTAQGLSSNQNEVAINSKSGLWRTALLNGHYILQYPNITQLFAADVADVQTLYVCHISSNLCTIEVTMVIYNRRMTRGWECLGDRAEAWCEGRYRETPADRRILWHMT